MGLDGILIYASYSVEQDQLQFPSCRNGLHAKSWFLWYNLPSFCVIIWNFPHHVQFKSSLLTMQRNGLQNAFFIRRRPFSKNHKYVQKYQIPTWVDNPASFVTIFAVCLAVSLFFRGWNFSFS